MKDMFYLVNAEVALIGCFNLEDEVLWFSLVA